MPLPRGGALLVDRKGRPCWFPSPPAAGSRQLKRRGGGHRVLVFGTSATLKADPPHESAYPASQVAASPGGPLQRGGLADGPMVLAGNVQSGELRRSICLTVYGLRQQAQIWRQLAQFQHRDKNRAARRPAVCCRHLTPNTQGRKCPPPAATFRIRLADSTSSSPRYQARIMDASATNAVNIAVPRQSIRAMNTPGHGEPGRPSCAPQRLAFAPGLDLAAAAT